MSKLEKLYSIIENSREVGVKLSKDVLQQVEALGFAARGTLGTGQRFTPKKRTVPVICFESEIDRLVYNLYGLTEEEIKIVEGCE